MFHWFDINENFRHIPQGLVSSFRNCFCDKDCDCWSVEKMSSNASGINMAVVFICDYIDLMFFCARRRGLILLNSKIISLFTKGYLT